MCVLFIVAFFTLFLAFLLIHVIVCISSCLLFIAEQDSVLWRLLPPFIHFLVQEYLGSFQFGASMNTVGMNIHSQVLV